MFGNSVHVMSSYIGAFATYLKWVWDFLIHLSFFQHQSVSEVPGNGQFKLGLSRFHQNPSSTEPEECAVCLSQIEEDDEIRELRCNHLFHRECLDRCLEHRHTTCPLCRDYLAGPRMVCELGRELLVFGFCSTKSSSDDDFDKWWIR